MEEMFSKLSTYGYLILFLYTLGGGMIALIAAGMLSFIGKMDITLCIVVATISNFIGDTILFWLSRYNKKEFSPFIKKQRRNLALSQILFKKYGDRIILVQKFIYGLKTLIPIAIGLTKYSFAKFSFLNAFSSAIWAITIGLVSYFAGDFVLQIYEKIKIYPWLTPLVLGVIIALIVIYFKFAIKRRIKM